MSNINDQSDLLEQLRKEFLDETTFHLEQCEESYLKLESPECRVTELTNIFRVAHSIKGSGAVVGYDDLAAFAHVVEDCLTFLRANPDTVTSDIISLLLQAGDAFKTRVQMLKNRSTDPWDAEALKAKIITAAEQLKLGAKLVVAPAQAGHANGHEEQDDHKGSVSSKVQSTAVKVDPSRIEAVLDLVGELVVIKSQLLQEYQGQDGASIRENEVLSLLDKTVRELQDKTLSMRMTSLKPLFLKCQRSVRDLSIKLGKPVDFVMSGEEIEIDRTMIELLNDPLTHIVRNALDHGIEQSANRKEKGKPEKGTISMSARQVGGRIVVVIKDDGGGINKDKALKKAIDLGLVAENARLSDQEIYGLIFAPGFSTAEIVTDVSGRGVGLDVVKSNIQKLKGTVEITSVIGKGSVFEISLPLTTAISEGIVVIINNVRFIIPMDGIRELLRIDEATVIKIKDDHECLEVRGRILPLVRMNNVMRSTSMLSHMNLTMKDVQAMTDEGVGRGKGMVVVIDHMGTFVAVTIDRIIGQNQVVVKSLGQNINSTNGVAGAAIMGDGKIALVLDIDGLVRTLRARGSRQGVVPRATRSSESSNGLAA